MMIDNRPLGYSREDKAAKSAVSTAAYAVAPLIVANETVLLGHYSAQSIETTPSLSIINTTGMDVSTPKVCRTLGILYSIALPGAAAPLLTDTIKSSNYRRH